MLLILTLRQKVYNMTKEEFEKLPSCTRYKNAQRDCHMLNSDDWDELEDSCQNCGWWKYNIDKDNETYEDNISMLE